MTIIRSLATALGGLSLAVSAVLPALAQDVGKPVNPSRDVGRLAPGEDNSYFHSHARIRIPAPMIPTNGRCSVWYPDKGQDKQAGPVACQPLPKVEPGGLLIAPSRDPVILEVTAYHAQQPGVVIGRATFDARTGLLQRTVNPDVPMDIERRASGAKR